MWYGKCLNYLKNVWMIWKFSCRSKKACIKFCMYSIKVINKVLKRKYTPWSIFGPLLCLKSCKHTTQFKNARDLRALSWCKQSFCFFLTLFYGALLNNKINAINSSDLSEKLHLLDNWLCSRLPPLNFTNLPQWHGPLSTCVQEQ